MTIIELQQGYFRSLSGCSKADALAAFATFQAQHPKARFWREFEAKDTATAPWATEWYVVDEAGLLRRHSAQYDSSG